MQHTPDRETAALLRRHGLPADLRPADPVRADPARAPAGAATYVSEGGLAACDDPAAFLSALLEGLPPGSGCLLTSPLTTPHVRGSGQKWRFTPEGLEHLARGAGFTVLEVGTRPSGGAGESSFALLRAGGGVAAAPVGSCLFVNTYYEPFLDSFYSSGEAARGSYDRQLAALQETGFGDSDFYSHNLAAAGWECATVVANAGPLQRAWAAENGADGRAGDELLVAQIRAARPDVVYFQDMHATPASLVKRIRPYCRLVAGQIASSLDFSVLPIRAYDVVFSSLREVVEIVRLFGVTAFHQPLAFDARLLPRLPAVRYAERPIECSFVGGLHSRVHPRRPALLETLAATTPVSFWGYGEDAYPEASRVRERFRGQAWGRDMFSLLATSKITVNCHGSVVIDGVPGLPPADAAARAANNMRLFEATGCGALLVTDYKDDLGELFEIGEEIVAYRSDEECAELVRYYLSRPAEAEKIAAAGRERTLRDHSYAVRMRRTGGLLRRELRRRAAPEPARDASAVSTGYLPIGPSDVTPALADGWKSDAIPARQRALVDRELAAMYRGTPCDPYRALAELLRPLLRDGDGVLEVGCSSGYYHEVITYLTGKFVRYVGVDYSPGMIAMAKELYDDAEFHEADGAALPFADRSLRFVVSSGVLLHVPDYRRHLRESARVADEYLILHRTPVSRTAPTGYFSKEAYGVPTIELRFSEQDVMAECASLGFAVVRGVQFEADEAADSFMVSYLLRREAP